HQGYTGSSISVLEFSTDSVAEIGVFLAYSNECETHVNNKFCDRGYKLTVKPGPKPLFFAQKFTNRGDEEYPRWVVSGKPAAAKRIGDATTKYELVK
ncbi:hypothetical protein, partial [Limosilactobacillus reuteri]|uniref:hypothetical protein n=1 Tax=Limosilactobacillus reuteri TaxID=1598 RepID=UPI002B051C48